MKERLQKIISSYGIASRRTAEKIIESGRVKVNGVTAEIGMLADRETDIIEYNGQILKSEPRLLYLMLNKPKGYVSTMSDERGRKTVYELVADCGQRVYPVGRLDINSEGLLLMTNDGNLTNKLTHPSFQVNKNYLTWVRGDISVGTALLRQPMQIDGQSFQAAHVNIVRPGKSEGLLEIIIHEGKNRQIRRMCQKAGLYVTRLKRIAEGELKLGELPAGKWRELTEEELKHLKNS